ncbi:hypothetical protein JTE90_005020 [Oedothorax gibbosus]|uniref:Uncharacterized protein n=1 Tax=Oedothorax gibbosus TaxID=931172 RepID=A0AAV6VAL7_9ARAC|nr:hypothetical protein JTE90_005020 [Oedothorax gibbosus]
MAFMLRFATFLFLLGWNILLTTGLPLFDSGESFATRHLRKSLEPESEYPVVFDSEAFDPRNSLPTAVSLIPELENLTQSHLPSFSDCNATSDVFLMTSACPVHVFYSLDPKRIPRVLVNMSCKSDEMPEHFGLGIYREQHVGCDAVTYKMPVLKMSSEAKRKVYWPSWENTVLACVPAIFPSRDLQEVNVEHLT